jgi:3',5'-cyclic AMP phosphodiesterase CpdA
VLPSDGRAGGLPSGTEAYYSFDYANVHFVVLDSHESPRSVGGAMLDWLEADLAATAQDWIIAYWHHPPYTKGSHDSDDESQLIQMRENALPILEEYGVDLVLAGHSHIYERSYLVGGAYDTPTRAAGHIIDGGDGRVDGDGAYQRVGPGALYVVAGHGGASVGGSADHPLMFFSERAQGSCLIDVEGDRLTLRNIRYDGVETDVVTLERPGRGLLVTAPTTGQQVLAGSDLEVRWASEGTSGGPVAIDVSLDGGSAWRTLVASTPDDGTHVWTTPARTSESVRVRVRSVEEPEIADESGRFALVDFATREVIGWGSVWEYRDDGQAQDADWVVRTGGWDSGPAQLGYGDGDEATRLRSEEPNIPSVYFRRTVELEGEPVSGELTVLYDDAVAVWVNGTLVYQIHMDNGLGFSSYSGGSGGDDAISGALLDSEALAAFRPGANVVAAMVKQRTSDSSDLSFDLRLNLGVRTELGEGGEDLGAVADATPDLGPADAGRRDLGAADMAHDSGARDTEGDLRAADDSGEDAGGASDLGAEVGDGGLADADVAVLDSSGSGGGEPTTPRGQAGAVTVQSDGCGGCATGGVSRGRPRGASWVLLVALVGAARLVTRRRG